MLNVFSHRAIPAVTSAMLLMGNQVLYSLVRITAILLITLQKRTINLHIHTYIRMYVRLFVRSFVRSLVHSYIHTYIHTLGINEVGYMSTFSCKYPHP